MATYEEFASLIMGTEVIQHVQRSIQHEAALALRDVCREHERTSQPVPDHHISAAGYMGEMIVRALIAAGLIYEGAGDRHSVRVYVPTQQGQEFYRKLREEGTFAPRRQPLGVSPTH